MSLGLADGYGPATDTVTLRVPMGDVSLTFAYGEEEPSVLEINVPERILGVDRDVWECFSDTSHIGTSFIGDGGIGCAGWRFEYVTKVGKESAVQIWTQGPGSFIAAFKDVLDDLGPVIGIEFEFVSTKDEADLSAHIGSTATPCLPEALGCASLSSGVVGGIDGGSIAVYNYSGEEFHELSDSYQDILRDAMAHELIHALTHMQHRLQPESIMNTTWFWNAGLSPMDERLLKLHGHPLVRPGMVMAEIEPLIMFSDELIDPQTDADLTKWKLVSNAYDVLREAESATFRVRSSLSACKEEFGWADYAVFDLERRARGDYSFGWVMIGDGSDRFYTYGGDTVLTSIGTEDGMDGRKSLPRCMPMLHPVGAAS